MENPSCRRTSCYTPQMLHTFVDKKRVFHIVQLMVNRNLLLTFSERGSARAEVYTIRNKECTPYYK